MGSAITLFVEQVDPVDLLSGRVVVRGEVWLEPVDVGACFHGVCWWDHTDPVDLEVQELIAPLDAQEAGRVSRVVVVLRGEGLARVAPGTVLLGSHPSSAALG